MSILRGVMRTTVADSCAVSPHLPSESASRSRLPSQCLYTTDGVLCRDVVEARGPDPFVASEPVRRSCQASFSAVGESAWLFKRAVRLLGQSSLVEHGRSPDLVSKRMHGSFVMTQLYDCRRRGQRRQIRGPLSGISAHLDAPSLHLANLPLSLGSECVEVVCVVRPSILGVNAGREDRVPVLYYALNNRRAGNQDVLDGRRESALVGEEALQSAGMSMCIPSSHSRSHVRGRTVKVGCSAHQNDPREVHETGLVSPDHRLERRVVLLSSESVDTGVVGPQLRDVAESLVYRSAVIGQKQLTKQRPSEIDIRGCNITVEDLRRLVGWGVVVISAAVSA